MPASRAPMKFSPPFAGIDGPEALAAVFAAPGLSLLYLHDPWCPINSRARSELSALQGPIHSVDVSVQHDLKHEVARRTGIRHESPQAILLRDGEPVWNASHHRITHNAAYEALAAAAEDIDAH